MGRYARLKDRERKALAALKRARFHKNQPSTGSVHVNRPLTNIAVAFLQDPELFFTPMIFPMVPVRKKSDSFFVWDRGDMNRDDARVVGPGAEYPIGIKNVSDEDYSCKVYKYSEMIADEERENADDPLQLDQMAVRTCMQKHAIRRDREWASKFFTTGVWTGGTSADPTPGTKWDDAANGNWIATLRPEIRALTKKGLSRRRLTLTLPPAVFDVIIDHAVTIDRIEAMNGAKQLDAPDEEDLARILRIGKVVVGESVYNSAAAGGATVDNFILNTDAVLLSYAPETAMLNVPSAGYTMSWSALGGAGAAVTRLRRDERDADQIKSRSAFDQRVIAAEAAVFVQNVLT